MDQNRSEAIPNQQQNVHLHMHHVCNCQGGLYPTYYPAVGYRTPLPSLVPYHTPSAMARPYLQHYQYTQYNVGSQYTVPIGHVAGSNTTIYGPTTASSGTIDLVYGSATVKERRDREEGNGDVDRGHELPEGYDYGQVTPPANELLITDTSEVTAQENFVKFLEKSCLTAEQIAYRNRNRPCFRNIQNLCIRTRSEILKPCTTISNIHSQGIPWATKDFIYAFVRLTNCWHILKGYWDNRDGSSLGKIEKELTPEFRSCYVRWEKETFELAGQLTKIFYNLDTNLNSTSSGANVYSSNNLIPPQVNLMKCSSEGAIKKPTTLSNTTTVSTMTNSTAISKIVRGPLHLSSNESPVTETIDQGNQTYSEDYCSKEEEYDSEEERTRRIYMKPGSYNVPKKFLEAATSGNSPRAIEFLETAQNVNKARQAANERYWANILTSAGKKLSQEFKTVPEEEEEEEEEEKNPITIGGKTNVPNTINVQKWLVSSNFSEYIESESPTSLQELKSYYVDNTLDLSPQLDSPIAFDKKIPSMTVLQRNKSIIEPPTSVRKLLSDNIIGRTNEQRSSNPYELKTGGLTEIGQCVLKNLVGSLKGHVLGSMAVNGEMDLEKILRKIKNREYSYVNEVVRDLRYMIKLWDEVDIHNTGWFAQKLELLLQENFSSYDFSDIKGNPAEPVGALKSGAIFSNDCDQFI
ncbi:hypothetical protein ABEB36_008274 [Hypothenemus hampei]|uniref:Uncharacterized protein n=1 Tax=Hypothenemus hampei TaxID=57062 RepID=A0ABD1ELB5_HYPHA